MLRAMAVSIGLMSLPGTASAQAYQLGIGDEIVISRTGSDEAYVSTVDLDGDVRLPEIGRISLVGLTLDGAEDALTALLEDGELYVDPSVQIAVQTYAPIVVAGDVSTPGRFAYSPGLSIAAAIALAGGPLGPGLSEAEVARALSEAVAGQKTANLDIALAAAQMLRFEAVLSGLQMAGQAISDARARVPNPEAALFSGLVDTERALLASARGRAGRLLAFWEEEIATVTAQRENFDQRIAVQLEVVESALRNLESAQELSDRGLQTAGRLANAEQRAAEARSRVLELEAAKIAAARALSTARREREVFVANQNREALEGLQTTNRAMAAAQYRYARFSEQIAVLSKGTFEPDEIQFTYTLQSARAGRPTAGAIAPETTILPGEVLIVTAKPIVDEFDG